jgi:hypothetical protein
MSGEVRMRIPNASGAASARTTEAHHPAGYCRPSSAKTRRWYRLPAAGGTSRPVVQAPARHALDRRRPAGAVPGDSLAADPMLYSARPRCAPGMFPRTDRRPAIARERRIGRPVRRPGDQQPVIRRSIGGATQAESIQVPSQQAWDFFIGRLSVSPVSELPWPSSGRPGQGAARAAQRARSDARERAAQSATPPWASMTVAP